MQNNKKLLYYFNETVKIIIKEKAIKTPAQLLALACHQNDFRQELLYWMLGDIEIAAGKKQSGGKQEPAGKAAARHDQDPDQAEPVLEQALLSA
ncbi:MAG TPA: hypothetical protein VG077_11395 [Verrucomicrobiae bacterium]|nr:hypothetical protein [Verrucomicrobiae bacterium]